VPNPPSAWVTHQEERLRIISAEVWNRVQARLEELRVLSGIGRTVALRAVEFVRRIPGTDCLTLRLQFKLV
jgi:hypothetical protein